jgi:ankyrin repeat protein
MRKAEALRIALRHESTTKIYHKIEKKDNEKKTALIHAAQKGEFKSVQSLLEQGADIHNKDWSGKTALDWANANGHQKVIELLTTRVDG